uniref:Armadillo repeat-containing protein 6 n=1 Tax=Phallusia mammillata TaxID=59560 RepID=A0A6F9D687_9ASCI|nr:armadillo repeat-containing protein 6 [Phallusia mammillata]
MAGNIKAITQDTFDCVVQENINDFGMEDQEAVDDAIEQFTSQGIPLTMIIKESQINGQHAVVRAVKDLEEYTINNTDKIDDAYLEQLLTVLSKHFQKDLSFRYQASKLASADRIIIKTCQICKENPQHLLSCLETFSCLLDGQPDLIQNQEIVFLLELLAETHSAEIQAVALKNLKLCCTKHEGNRVHFVKQGGIEKSLKTAEQHQEVENVIKEVCGVLRCLALDDDVRVQFGKAHEHIKKVVNDHKGIERLFELLKVHEEDAVLAKELCLTLSNLMVRNEFCQQFVDLGGLEVINRIFNFHLEKQVVIKSCITLLKAISGNDEVKVAVVKAGIVDYLLKALDEHASNAQICEACFAALTTLTLRNPSHCDVIMSKRAAPLMTQAMRNHQDRPGVQKQACMAIRNLVARTRHHTTAFIENGAENLIRQASENYKSVLEDEAKAALRDLDVKVDLKERWKGKNAGVTY